MGCISCSGSTEHVRDNKERLTSHTKDHRRILLVKSSLILEVILN
ncbi:hypothetical protein HanXRQr2_Chr13g0601171 [Helianthus annuus]|uniref:Uncharacterized protein n=1 Tax=Helianthus annuus TaxID=4232 RepID=A0A9K3EJN8_HELAN|nr:hypothetical protein HanXRQr2_Chr13g0601171 [Helianthus annuus]KAJ0850312.1 hypothetical protein HanPSC8_Chr13g0579191 [Helianthus annuus]